MSKPSRRPTREARKKLAERLKQYFPRLPVMLLLDGLYPNGPLMEQCRL